VGLFQDQTGKYNIEADIRLPEHDQRNMPNDGDMKPNGNVEDIYQELEKKSTNGAARRRLQEVNVDRRCCASK
jgi:hypothetical protein